MHPIFLSLASTSTPYRDAHEPCRGTRKMGHTATGDRLIGPRGTISRQTCGFFSFSFFHFLLFLFTIIISPIFVYVWPLLLADNNSDRCPRALKAAGLLTSPRFPPVFLPSSLSHCFVQRCHEGNSPDIIPSARIRIIKPENPDRVFAFYSNVNHDPRANDHARCLCRYECPTRRLRYKNDESQPFLYWSCIGLHQIRFNSSLLRFPLRWQSGFRRFSRAMYVPN